MPEKVTLGREKAIELAKSNWWELCETPREIVGFQLFTEELCMPFSTFHEAVEKCLGRPVFTHEFGMNWDGLKAEFLGEKQSPSLQEIIEMIPESKRVLIIEGSDHV